MLQKLTTEVFKRIVTTNSKTDHTSIPHSDSFFKEISNILSLNSNSFKEVINILKESHKILIIEITKEDEPHNIQRVDGFIDADLTTIRKLKIIFQKLLVEEYEKKFKKRYMASQIIKELFPSINLYNNTTLGHIANKTIMLTEYEKLLEKEFNDYTEDWKTNKLNEILKIKKESVKIETNNFPEKDGEEVKPKKIDDSNKRAVDSESYNGFNEAANSASLNKVLKIYGVQFFFRVNLRKHNFKYIQEIIESKQISRKNDLKILKDMISKIKSNKNIDSKLNQYIMDLYSLEKTLSKYIRISN